MSAAYLSSSLSLRPDATRSWTLWALATSSAAGPATSATTQRESPSSKAEMVTALWSTSAAPGPPLGVLPDFMHPQASASATAVAGHTLGNNQIYGNQDVLLPHPR